MTAASFWSLLAPGIERAQEQMNNSPWACLPIALGFACGAAFVWAADFVLPFLGFSSEDMVTAFITNQVLFSAYKFHIDPGTAGACADLFTHERQGERACAAQIALVAVGRRGRI